MAQSPRITIGGIEVDAPGKAASPAQDLAGGKWSPVGEIPVAVSAHKPNPVLVTDRDYLDATCLIPAGSWRMIGVAIIALLIALVAAAILARPRPR